MKYAIIEKHVNGIKNVQVREVHDLDIKVAEDRSIITIDHQDYMGDVKVVGEYGAVFFEEETKHTRFIQGINPMTILEGIHEVYGHKLDFGYLVSGPTGVNMVISTINFHDFNIFVLDILELKDVMFDHTHNNVMEIRGLRFKSNEVLDIVIPEDWMNYVKCYEQVYLRDRCLELVYDQDKDSFILKTEGGDSITLKKNDLLRVTLVIEHSMVSLILSVQAVYELNQCSTYPNIITYLKRA